MLTKAEAEYWWHDRNSKGWRVSSANGAERGTRITSWRSDMWKARGWVKEASARQRQQVQSTAESTVLVTGGRSFR